MDVCVWTAYYVISGLSQEICENSSGFSVNTGLSK